MDVIPKWAHLCVFKSSKVLCLLWLYAHCCKSRIGWQCTVSTLWVGDTVHYKSRDCMSFGPTCCAVWCVPGSFSAFAAVSSVWNQNPIRYTCMYVNKTFTFKNFLPLTHHSLESKTKKRVAGRCLAVYFGSLRVVAVGTDSVGLGKGRGWGVTIGVNNMTITDAGTVIIWQTTDMFVECKEHSLSSIIIQSHTHLIHTAAALVFAFPRAAPIHLHSSQLDHCIIRATPIRAVVPLTWKCTNRLDEWKYSAVY